MSGTSLDGIDVAIVEIQGRRIETVGFQTTPYPVALRRALLGELDAAHISRLNFQLGALYARAVLRAVRRFGAVELIGCHGQTIFHEGRVHTLQIGEAAVLAEATGVPVVSNFRARDIAAGGEGAPLVPMVDYLLLADDRQGSVALNIGGIANVTVVPAAARPEQVFGFDTGPGNMIMDALVRRFSRGRQRYDGGGRRAARGRVIERVLEESLRFPFFRRRPPKSAGREEFGAEFVSRYFPASRFSPEDLLRTAVELTVRSIAGALERFVFPRVGAGGKLRRLVISGGGAHNRLLVAGLQSQLSILRVQVSDEYGWPVDAKEAMAFALLADRTLHGLPGNLPAVTGARRPVMLGTLTSDKTSSLDSRDTTPSC